MAALGFDLECDKVQGFILDPNEHKRFGYITKLRGFGLDSPINLAADLTASCPYHGNAAPAYSGIQIDGMSQGQLGKVKVVAVLEKFHWGGGVNQTLDFDTWMSQENALAITAAQQSMPTSTRIDQLAFWIADYDQELKQWYEQLYPLSNDTITGVVGGQANPELNVDLNGQPVIDGRDTMLYRVSLKVAPAGGQMFTIFTANSAKMTQSQTWGVG